MVKSHGSNGNVKNNKKKTIENKKSNEKGTVRSLTVDKNNSNGNGHPIDNEQRNDTHKDKNQKKNVKAFDKNRHLKGEDKRRRKLRKVVRIESKRILQIIVPICLCMMIVVVAIHFLPLFSNGIEKVAKEAGVKFYESRDAPTHEKIGSALIVVVIFIVILAFVTFCMAIVIIYQWKRCMNCFFVFAFVIYLGLLMTIVLSLIVYEYNIPIDWITVLFFVVNYTVLGEVVFFVGGPKILKQTYLIIIASNVALLLILIIPDWTAWLLLVALCLWDLYIVLHETGPLNRIFQSGANDLPPILYATAIWLQTSTSSDDGGHYEIGLGDFVFYSILVGKSFTSGDFFTAIICFVSILVGLAITMFILMMTNKPLPALPISVMLGVITNFMTKLTIAPFNDVLTERLIFL